MFLFKIFTVKQAECSYYAKNPNISITYRTILESSACFVCSIDHVFHLPSLTLFEVLFRQDKGGTLNVVKFEVISCNSFPKFFLPYVHITIIYTRYTNFSLRTFIRYGQWIVKYSFLLQNGPKEIYAIVWKTKKTGYKSSWLVYDHVLHQKRHLLCYPSDNQYFALTTIT